MARKMRNPAGCGLELNRQRLGVKRGGQIGQVGVRDARFQQRAVEPGAGVLAPQARLHVTVVLEVVAEAPTTRMFLIGRPADAFVLSFPKFLRFASRDD
jgi:hypothetical protein